MIGAATMGRGNMVMENTIIMTMMDIGIAGTTVTEHG
jgi:hypothetical protein